MDFSSWTSGLSGERMSIDVQDCVVVHEIHHTKEKKKQEYQTCVKEGTQNTDSVFKEKISNFL